MPSYIAEDQRGTEARVLNVLFPMILQGLQLAHHAAAQFGAPPRPLPMEQRPFAYAPQQRHPMTRETHQQMAAERSFMDVAAVLMPVVQAITPPLVEQLLSFGPPKADTDQNEEERFLQFAPQLIGTIAPIVMQVLPGLLQTMHGRRTEHPVRVTDRELNQRYFGPILAAMMPAIVSSMPELLAIVHGDQRGPIRYERMPGRPQLQLIRVGRNDLVNAHRLRDGDVLHLTETPAPPGTTEIRIGRAPHSQWWKAIEVTDESGRTVCFADTDGEPHASFDSRSVERGGTIVFWKAQTHGERVPMYVLPMDDLSPDATCFTFHWAAG
ncbi:MAG: hypothetical protein HOW71_41775 [Nonomuraea sp.]|nr:hypothetical protein [Nonomuraea sp.]NUP68707.1 hypothetical protein [Nonomuraea sp.]NUS03445.1 hypothetical protein [Nonomuraea sp.]